MFVKYEVFHKYQCLLLCLFLVLEVCARSISCTAREGLGINALQTPQFPIKTFVIHEHIS